MERPADFSLSQTEQGRTALCVGDWTAVCMDGAQDRLATAIKGLPDVTLDLTKVGRCDTSGAHELLRASEGSTGQPKFLARPEITRLLELVQNAHLVEPSVIRRRHSLH